MDQVTHFLFLAALILIIVCTMKFLAWSSCASGFLDANDHVPKGAASYMDAYFDKIQDATDKALDKVEIAVDKVKEINDKVNWDNIGNCLENTVCAESNAERELRMMHRNNRRTTDK